MSIERYADALYDREQILDRCEISYETAGFGGNVVGDVARAWKLLANHARLHCLSFRPESLDLTNRDHGWEARIASDPVVRAKFRRAYALVLVRSGIRLYSTNGVALDESVKVNELVRDEARMRNPLLFVKARIPGLTVRSLRRMTVDPSATLVDAPPTLVDATLVDRPTDVSRDNIETIVGRRTPRNR